MGGSHALVGATPILVRRHGNATRPHINNGPVSTTESYHGSTVAGPDLPLQPVYSEVAAFEVFAVIIQPPAPAY
jgi:hypothetical protein